ncbi:hypothetical protein SKAU_G00083680 [Synaphobranchus kaupii]|uniref:Uncharacterized protein n=1 Tax=Synaphobranchus kaupii TaxID=118154 RepID=A0A9Q1J3J7_SYNKA|nr:hypothetical protein SKAU_G00083680 [Synaphobranchus kaupii]
MTIEHIAPPPRVTHPVCRGPVSESRHCLRYLSSFRRAASRERLVKCAKEGEGGIRADKGPVGQQASVSGHSKHSCQLNKPRPEGNRPRSAFIPIVYGVGIREESITRGDNAGPSQSTDDRYHFHS